MKAALNAREARVIGCLIEKGITTPEQYPLTLNALTAACNQKSNREPVLDLSEGEVQATVDGLVKRFLVSDKGGYGGRTTRYRHRFCNTEFGTLTFSPFELGVICVLLLRGPQTPGELRQRTNRLCDFADVEAVEEALNGLMTRADGPYVARLPRAPGERESRYTHLFGDTVPDLLAEDAPIRSDDAGLLARVERLEALVEELRADVRRLGGEAGE
ncbi:MAG: YceH family protein [Gammaproteobacteria bacterium]